MKRAALRCLQRYLHLVMMGLVVTLFLYVVIMQSFTFNASVSREAYTAALRRTLAGNNVTLLTTFGAVTGTGAAQQTSSLLLAGVPRSYKGYLTIGIPTLKRPKGEYFFSTLASLLQQSTPTQHNNVTLVILLADRDPEVNRATLAAIKTKYSAELREGLMLVVSAPDTEHLFRDNSLKRTFNDSLTRVRWRSKQNLDYAALMEIAANISTYYLQIEDDVTAAPNYIQHIQTFVTEHARKPWAGLEVCPHGFIGKLFRSLDLPKLVTILRTFHLEMPCDFLIHHFYHLMLQTEVIRRKGNLFFHQGKYSSLANVTRKIDRRESLRLRTWVPAVQKKHKQHINPPADLYTSIAVYQTYSLAAAYDLQADSLFFWGKDVKDGDDVTVVFRSPQKVSRIVVETGLHDKGVRRDFVRNGTVEFGEKAYVGQRGQKVLCTDTRDLGSFVQGRFNQSLDSRGGVVDVQCFTIVITHAQKEWVAIPEIAVFVRD